MKRLTPAQRKALDAATQMLQEWSERESARILNNPNADGWIRLIEILEKARKDRRVASSDGAVDFLDLVVELASDALTASTADQAIEPLNDVMPQAILGGKFLKGRKPNTGGPIRKRIEKELAKDPTLMPRHLWNKIKSKPPKGWEFFDNDAGKYIEGPKGGDGMAYARFSEVCKEEKDKLKS